MLLILFIATGYKSRAQSQEVQQLLLNVEKLSQFKNILRDMKAGYEIISKGYNAVRDISKGNFSLHETFLDALMAVSPQVKKYHRIADIIRCQGNLLSEYKAAYKAFVATDSFNAEEITYMADVYKQLNSASLKNLDALLTVITAGQLRMSDDERLKAIDQIFEDMQDKLLFLRHFNNQGFVLSRQRNAEKREISDLQKIYQLNP